MNSIFHQCKKLKGLTLIMWQEEERHYNLLEYKWGLFDSSPKLVRRLEAIPYCPYCDERL